MASLVFPVPLRPAARPSSPISFAFPKRSSVSLLRAGNKTAPLILASGTSGSSRTTGNFRESLQALDSLIRRSGIFLTATAFFLGCLFNPSVAKPLLAASPVAVEMPESQTEEEKEQFLEKYLEEQPDDSGALKALMEVKIKMSKFTDAISAIDRLVTLEPEEKEWPLMRGHVRSYEGDEEGAKEEFEAILARDPLSVEAYHGLVIASSQAHSLDELKGIAKRVESAMVQCCNDEKRKEDSRDFKLLLAQIRFVEGRYEDALKVYQELVKEDPQDFRPYLCQGIIYTLLRKKDMADKQFQKYKRLVPKGHAYARFFEDSVLGTKVFSQLAENESSQR